MILENYNKYAELVTTGKIIIRSDEITKQNWHTHLGAILNILRDGIETEFIQSRFISVDFGDGIIIDLSVMDYFFNLIMWRLLIFTNIKLEPKHIFFDQNITRQSIKSYIDKFFIQVNRKKFPNIILNNIIDDALYNFSFVDEFSMYLANTINLEDTIDLMNKYKEFDDLIHVDLSDTPIEDVKAKGMDATNKVIDYIKKSGHCLADSFKSCEGINTKQFKEFSVSIGSKPDGQGGVFPAIINSNFLIGGVNDILSYFIESSTGRTAQILSHMNVGSSGHFARLLGLNNMDTIIHQDPNYVCDSKNFQELYIKDNTMLELCDNRYYRMNPKGMEYLLNSSEDKHLIGKTIYLRSPMTCASAARGEGICYRCYGDLAHTNNDINVGKIAAEELSSKLTQILLSAKHLLESLVKKIKWSKRFFDIFDIEGNVIKLIDDMNYKDFKLYINPDSIALQDEYDNFDYNEYITEFEVEFPNGEVVPIYTSESDNIYITNGLNEIIREKADPIDNKICINMDDLKDSDLFLLMLHNNEISRTLDKLKDIINKSAITKSMNRNQLLQAIMETNIEGNLGVASVHCEVILSNQLRAIDDILSMPQWEYDNEECKVLTLNEALMDNPSITVALSYQKIARALFDPLSFRKNNTSFLDLFFIEKPQTYLSGVEIVNSKPKDKSEINMINPIVIDKK